MANLNVRGIPSDLRDLFKAACILKGSTMQAELIRLMEEEVRRQQGQGFTQPQASEN